MEGPATAPENASGLKFGVGPYLVGLLRSGELDSVLAVHPAMDVDRVTPFFAAGADLSKARHAHLLGSAEAARYPHSGSFVGRLRDALVLGVEGIVVHKNLVVGDTFRNFAAGPAAPIVLSAGIDQLTVKPGVAIPARRLVGAYFCGFAARSALRSHWFIGTLPRLVAFIRLREVISGLKLLLPRFPPDSFQAQALTLLHISASDIVEIGDNEAVACEALYVMNCFDQWSIAPFCKVAADWLVAAARPQDRGITRIEDRIFFFDGEMTSRIGNFPTVQATFERYQFECIDITRLSATETIDTLHRAKFAATQFGRADGNLFLCRPGARILELRGPADLQPQNWSIASCGDIGYGYLAGQPADDGSFVIPEETLATAIDTMLGGPPRVPRMALCAIGKDEGAYLAEWIAFHIVAGVAEIRYYDNGSTDNSRAILASAARFFPVTMVAWAKSDAFDFTQRSAYADAVAYFNGRADFLGFCDVDEFMYGGDGLTLPVQLSRFPTTVGAIAVNQRVFGSSGFLSYEPELVTTRFTRSAPSEHAEHRWFKTIARPSVVTGFDSVHSVVLRHGQYLASDGSILARSAPHPGCADRAVHGRIRLNHYSIKSKEEFSNKQLKWRAAGNAQHAGDEYFTIREKYANDEENLEVATRSEEIRAVIDRIVDGMI